MSRVVLWLIIVLVVSLSACQANSTPDAPVGVPQDKGAADTPDIYSLDLAEAPANYGDLKMNLDQLGSFHARFTLTFTGPNQWTYQVDTRSDGTNTEYQLMIEGLNASMDLGDVRLVNSQGYNYMAGPATDGVCIQFPDSFSTEPLFLGPTEFIRLKELNPLPVESGTETILGRETTRYLAATQQHLGWQDVSTSFWLDSQTQSVLRYEFFASGNDPLYFQGNGNIHGLFEVLEIGPQQIEAVPDCGIDFPLPGDVADLVRFPGLVSFNTRMGVEQLEGFFNGALESRGWLPGQPQKNDQTKDVMLGYTAQGETIIIHLSPISLQDLAQGYLVEIYFDE